MKLGRTGAAIVLVFSLTPATASAITCAELPGFCTTDPCVVPLIVENSCTFDFGDRDVVLEGARFGWEDDNRGELSLVARNITVQGPVLAGGGDWWPPCLILTAAESITVNDKIVIRDPVIGAGCVVRLDAGTDIAVNDRILDRDAWVDIDAGGDVILDGPIKCRRVDANVAGSFEIRKPIRAGAGARLRQGEIDIVAGGDVRVYAPLRTNWDGIDIRSSGGSIEVTKPLLSLHFLEGGHFDNGFISLSAATGVTVSRPLRGLAAFVSISGGSGPVLVTGSIAGRGRCAYIGSDGDVTVDTTISGYPAKPYTWGSCGTVIVSNLGHAEVRGRINVNGGPFHNITVRGASADVDIRGEARGREGQDGGVHTYEATAGDLRLAGRYFADGAKGSTVGGTFQATASGNLLVQGSVLVGSGGCIGLSAGGILDTSAATFDQPVTTSCP